MTLWRRGDVAWVGAGDSVVALPLTNILQSPHTLRGSAAAIWHELPAPPDDGASAEAIAASVAGMYGAHQDVVLPDVQGFLTQLEADGLAVRREGEA